MEGPDVAAFELSWYLPGRVLYTRHDPDPAVVIARNQHLLQLLETEGQPPQVHLLIDYTGRGITYDTLQLWGIIHRSPHSPDYQQLLQKLAAHPLMGWVVGVACQDPRMRVASTITATRYNIRRHDEPTMELALKFLKRMDPTLDVDEAAG